MAIFAYKAISKESGKTTKGVLDADNIASARRKLRDQNLYPTQLTETSGGGGKVVDGGILSQKRGAGHVSTRDLALMTRQFATLLRAGMPMVEALSALLEQTTKPRLQTAIYDIRDRVNSGSTLADALKEHPRIFGELYVNMVHAGEVSGALDAVLVRLTDVIEHQARMKGQIMSALAYPCFMGLFALSVVVFLMMVIVPRITLVFIKQKAELPALTKGLIVLSTFVGKYWIVLLLLVFGLFSLWRFWISRKKGRLHWDRMKLRFPLYGSLHLKLVCARFTRTLGTMLQSGLTMLPALDVVTSVVGNTYIRAHMEEVKAGVRRGRDLAQPLKETGLFPPMLIHMVNLGQRSGEIENMLVQVAETYDEDVRLTIAALVALLEPAIIVVMGIFIGILVVAILMPILKMSTNVGGRV